MKTTDHKKAFYQREKNTLYIIIFGIILFSMSFFIDKTVIAYAKTMQTPYGDYFLSGASNTWLLVMLLGVLIMLLLYLKQKQHNTREFLLIMGLTLAITGIIKITVMRERPLETIFEAGFFDYSFPSQHTAFAVATLVFVWKKLSSIKYIKYVYTGLAILVGLSRIYLQAHYLSDVIAGALIGYIVSWCVLGLQYKIKEKSATFIKTL
ncbi:phosphatase PAP2 family protein [Candidatus Woesearchaeota archaeon]|nr:phosphatase PAP2 family protein [Candidatus Woesearchaeota archaeon]